jgi:hypothetical protein
VSLGCLQRSGGGLFMRNSFAYAAASRLFGALVLISATLLLSSQLALAQFTQQGPKLVGTGAVGAADQGWSVAVSADGNTAIVGGSRAASFAAVIRLKYRVPA